MKISYKCDYALKAMLELSLKHEEGAGVLSLSEIAEPADIPEKFLEQILLTLKQGGFVKSKRGVKGGFALAKSPDKITVGEIIRFIEGPIEPISCVEEGYKGCADIKRCIFREVWKEVGRAISIAVDTLSFKEMVIRCKERKLNLRIAYDYSI